MTASPFTATFRILALAGLGLAVTLACQVTVPPPGGDGGDGGGGGGDGGSGGGGDGGSGGGGSGGGDAAVYNNTNDRSNRNARFLGGSACRACHPDIDAQQSIHGHAFKLNAIQGAAPTYPEIAENAVVPSPPAGVTWTDVAYVIGGYTKKARYVDLDGFIYLTGTNGLLTQYNLDFPPNGTTAGFVAYERDRTTPKPYDYSCFVCHTTGPQPQDEDAPIFQDNRPGLQGTWQEPGIQCEACHGPGSNHVGNPPARDAFVDTSARFCGECHNRPFNADGSVILASGGYIKHHEQYPELLASGVHASFQCTTCHDPHVSVIFDRENALRQTCTDCHADQTMAGHAGITYVRGNYVETLNCESCHMPFATRSATAASEAVVGPAGRMGDTRTHIFRINTNAVDYTAFFEDDLGSVRTDDAGHAAVTVDFVCLRCHNDIGSAFNLELSAAASIARNMHGLGQ